MACMRSVGGGFVGGGRRSRTRSVGRRSVWTRVLQLQLKLFADSPSDRTWLLTLWGGKARFLIDRSDEACWSSTWRGHEFMQNSARVHILGIGSNGPLQHSACTQLALIGYCASSFSISTNVHHVSARVSEITMPMDHPSCFASPFLIPLFPMPVRLTAIPNVTSTSALCPLPSALGPPSTLWPVPTDRSIYPDSLLPEEGDGRQGRKRRQGRQRTPSFSACFVGGSATRLSRHGTFFFLARRAPFHSAFHRGPKPSPYD